MGNLESNDSSLFFDKTIVNFVWSIRASLYDFCLFQVCFQSETWVGGEDFLIQLELHYTISHQWHCWIDLGNI